MNKEMNEVKKELSVNVTKEETVEVTLEALKSPDSSKKSSNKKKTEREKQFEKDIRPVKGMFKSNEGGVLSFHYGKWPEVPIVDYSFIDGQIYTIPYMVATHINANCSYPVHSHAKDAEGRMSMRVGSRIQRFSFVPLDFIMEDSSAPSNIITVERA